MNKQHQHVYSAIFRTSEFRSFLYSLTHFIDFPQALWNCAITRLGWCPYCVISLCVPPCMHSAPQYKDMDRWISSIITKVLFCHFQKYLVTFIHFSIPFFTPLSCYKIEQSLVRVDVSFVSFLYVFHQAWKLHGPMHLFPCTHGLWWSIKVCIRTLILHCVIINPFMLVETWQC